MKNSVALCVFSAVCAVAIFTGCNLEPCNDAQASSAGDCGGYRHFILAPIPDRRVGKVDAEFNSPYGKIRSAWAYAGNGGCSWTFTIPANTTATVKLPNGKTEELAAGTYTRTLVSAK